MIDPQLDDLLMKFSDAVYSRPGCGDSYVLGGEAHQAMLVALTQVSDDPAKLQQFNLEVGARMEELGLNTRPRHHAFDLKFAT